LRDEAHGEQSFGLIGRERGPSTMHAPGFDELVGELAARFHEEGRTTDGDVADFEGEDCLWSRRLVNGDW
jgi:hypothetical protein